MKESTNLIKYENKNMDDRTVEMVNPSVYNGATVLFKDYNEYCLTNSGKYKGAVNGTDRLPTQRLFEDALRNFEKGYLTRAFQSGLSAIKHKLFAFTKTNDHILICDNVYSPTAIFCHKFLSGYHVEVSPIPSSVGTDIEKYIKKNIKLIFLESPGSNTFEIQDIPVITKIAREKNIITVIDNTWATPLYLNPFDLEIDISIQSVTKYISDYSDILMGTVTTNEQYAEVFDRFTVCCIFMHRLKIVILLYGG